ncbi:MAG: UvrD-helicase domain-containing protein [Bacteroidia bacterium]
MQNNFVVYKSSAGSGKTYTLVREYLKLALADPHRLNKAFRQILAITFTNKAAAEMKERILKALLQISNGEKIPLAADLQAELKISETDLHARCEELHSHLLHQYADFSVCTIDSFVYRIVKRFSLDLQLPANFSVETDEETALWWAIDSLLTNMQENAAVKKLLEEYTEEKVDEQKNWKVENEIFALAKSILIAKKDGEADLLSQQEINNLSEVKKLLKSKTKEVEDHYTLLADKFFKLISSKGISPADFYYGDKGVPGYFKKIASGNYDDEKLVGSYVLKAVQEDVWYTAKNANPAIDAVKGEILSLFNEIETYRENVNKSYYLHRILLKNINALCVLSEVSLLVKQYKAEKNIVFISEFNKAVAGFIQEEPVPFIYERLGDKYKNYLIDEFQDTSGLQWLNLLPLVHNSLSEGKFCMLVGDSKQSIYRWRGADIEQFVNLPKIENKKGSSWINEQQQALAANYEEKYLKINRRSCAEIISFNNKLFDFLADNYLEGKYKRVYENGAQEPWGRDKGKITVSFVKEEKELAQETVLADTLKLIREAEAKNYSFADMAVIVRQNKNGNVVANYLLQNGVPVVSSDSLLLKSCPEVNFLISFLGWMINRHDAVSATAVLSYLRESSKINVSHDVLKEGAYSSGKLQDTLTALGIETDINKLSALPLFELCTEVSRLFELENRNALYLNFFLDEVQNYSLRENNSVFAFLQWWKKQAEKVSVKIPQNTNAVKIVTIHACKGLEFPVVIFPFADWRTQMPENLLIDTHEELPQLPIALVKTEKDLKKTKFSEQAVDEEQKQNLDNLNLLYVACTRAVEELHIIAREGGIGVTVATWLKNYVQQYYAGQTTENKTEIGEGIDRTKHVVKESPSLKPATYRSLHEAVTIKLSDFEDETQGKRLYGITLHNILSEIKTGANTEAALKKALVQGNINEEQVGELRALIETLVGNPLVKNYFAEGVQIKTETELFLDDGEIIRPDRVIICPDHLAVIDFKTGERKSEHIKQIQQYKYTLTKVSQKPVKAFLAYLPGDVVEVV